ncbi:MAG: hypothetical protein R2736_03395 [Solirubrobacterales bacterium]
MSDVLAAGLAAAVVSGAPSTAWALVRGGDPLEAARAAGAMVVGERAGAAAQLAAAVPVHLALSLGWTWMLARIRPARGGAGWGRRRAWSSPRSISASPGGGSRRSSVCRSRPRSPTMSRSARSWPASSLIERRVPRSEAEELDARCSVR